MNMLLFAHLVEVPISSLLAPRAKSLARALTFPEVDLLLQTGVFQSVPPDSKSTRCTLATRFSDDSNPMHSCHQTQSHKYASRAARSSRRPTAPGVAFRLTQ